MMYVYVKQIILRHSNDCTFANIIGSDLLEIFVFGIYIWVCNSCENSVTKVSESQNIL